MNHKMKLIVVLVLLLATAGLSQAQDMPPLPGEAVLDGLGAPRGIAFDADGNLYVADAGTGGEFEIIIPIPEFGIERMARLGMTGKIITVAPDGTTTDHISGIPSYGFPDETVGIYRAIPNGDSLWLIVNGQGPAPSSGQFWSDNVVELDAETLDTRRIINLNAFERDNDPDGRGYDTNVTDIAWGADGTMYITDAGANALLSWTEADGLSLVTAWGNDVPTSVEVADNGDLYVGFLGEGIAPAAGRIEHWSGGEVVETFDGLTAVTDILLDGDTLYAVQMFLFGEEGPGPGNVITVDADGATPVAEGLITPFGLAISPDGDLYVSWGTIAFESGMTGGVVKIAQ
ncbi:MAG: ScyD/ScyE family protein [Chloroflexi bacterium]|nr:MAG: ScyD/ScyE family protein [Chloroflexota bacterium]